VAPLVLSIDLTGGPGYGRLLDMTTTSTVLYDAETGKRITVSQPAEDTPAHRREIKGWVLRYRAAYGRRTGHKIRVEQEEQS
jgi:hypothetical protein